MATEENAPPRPPRRWALDRPLIVRAVMLLGLLGGLVAFAYYLRHAPLWLVNGLEIPVVVEIDGERRELGPGEKSSSWTSTGVHRVRVWTREGAALDEDVFCMEWSGDDALHVYNVLGAAPVYVETVEYSRTASFQNNKEPNVDFLGGRRFVSKRRVDYIFSTPPSSLSTKSATGTLQKTHADIAQGGWRTTAGYLASNLQPDVAAAMTRDVSRAQPEDLAARGTALHFTEIAGGQAAGAAFALEWRDETPKNEDAHRNHQNYMIRLGRMDEVIEEYKKWYAAGDKSPEAASLLARVLPPKEARAVLDEALGRHPDAPVLLLRKGLVAAFELQHEEAAALFAKADASPAYIHYAEEHGVTLVALGRVKEAAERLSRAAEKSAAEKSDNLPLALTYARVADLLPAEAPVPAWTYVDRLAAAPNGAWRGAWARSLAGETTTAPADDGMTAQIVAIHRKAGESAADAWSACAAASPAALRQIDVTVAILLGTEFARVGDLDMAERILSPRRDLQTPWRALAVYVITGAEAPELVRLRPEDRAALDFVRARALQAAGQPADVALASATRRDVLRGVVTRAMTRWAKPGAAAPDARNAP